MSIPKVYTTHTLLFPIQNAEGKEVTKLEIRRAKAKDLQSARQFKTDAEQEAFLFAAIAGLTMEDIGELDVADYSALQNYFKSMTEGK